MTARKGGYRGKVSTGWGASSRPTPQRSKRRQLAASSFWPMVGEPWRGWQPFVMRSAGEEVAAIESEGVEAEGSEAA